jgi:hypothetical protein
MNFEINFNFQAAYKDPLLAVLPGCLERKIKGLNTDMEEDHGRSSREK